LQSKDRAICTLFWKRADPARSFFEHDSDMRQLVTTLTALDIFEIAEAPHPQDIV
jgi:hypothetical protein